MNFKKPWVNSLELLVVSDTHLKSEEQRSIDKVTHFVGVANQGKQDLVLHLGDFIDGRSVEQDDLSMTAFLTEWNKLNVDNLVITGNHEYYYLPESELPSYFSYTDRPLIAGSKFNHYEEIKKGNAKYGIFVTDRWRTGSNLSAIDQWLLSTIENTNCDVYIFIEHSVQSLNRVVSIAEQSGIKNAMYIHGHNHPSTGIRFIKKQGEVKHYNMGAMQVDGSPYARVRVNPDGNVITTDFRFLGV